MAKMRPANLIFYVLIGILLCGIGVNRYHHHLDDKLLEAVTKNDEAAVLKLLQRGANPDYSLTADNARKERISLLQAAIHSKENLRIVQALLEHGANPNPSLSDSATPLRLAVSTKRNDILPLLLEKGAHESALEASKTLHLAALENREAYSLLRRCGYPATLEDAVRVGDIVDVRALLDQDAATTPHPALSASPLILALAEGENDIAKLLIARGADVNPTAQSDSLLTMALRNRKVKPEVVALLKAKGAHINLPEAIKARDIPTIRDLIRQGANVNLIPLDPSVGANQLLSNNAPLFLAINTRNPAIVRLLLDGGADINLQVEVGERPLMRAAAQGNPDIVCLLLARGAKINTADNLHRTAVKHAIEKNHPNLYYLLKAQGAKIDLFDAVSAGDVEQTRRLVQQGANVNQPNREGDTPLMLAALRGRVSSIHALLDLGANIEATTPQGETALLKVAWTDQTESVRVLLDRGANPNAAHKSGKTALMRAAEAGRLESVRKLLAKGGVPGAATQRGDTALRLAERRGHADAAALLRQAGAKE